MVSLDVPILHRGIWRCQLHHLRGENKRNQIATKYGIGGIKKEPNHQTPILVATAVIETVNDEDGMYVGKEDHRTELDSHANMAVVGRHTLIISNIERKSEVL